MMRWIISILLLAALQLRGADPDFYRINEWDPSVSNPGGTYPYAWTKSNYIVEEGAWYVRLSSTNRTATIQFREEKPPGTYYFWLYGWDNPAGWVVFNMGGSVVSNQISDTNWKEWGSVTTTNAASSVDVTVVRMSADQDYRISNIAITTNANWAVSDQIFKDFTAPTTTNIAAVKGNLIPNSSFELGFGHGWAHSRKGNLTTEQYAQRLEDAISRDGGHTGEAYADIGDTNKVRYQLYAPSIRLRGGREYRNYTLSFWAKGGGTLTVYLSPLLASVVGQPYDSRTFTFSVASTPWTRYSTNFYYAPVPSREVKLTLQSSAGTDVDDIQLEEGTLTDWAPRHPVEAQIWTGRWGNVFDVGEEITAYLRCYNTSGGTENRTAYIQAYDVFNNLVFSGTNSLSIPSGLSTNAVGLTITNRGTFRITARLSGDPFGVDETQVTVTKLPSYGDFKTNSIIGIHGMVDGPIAASNRVWGYSWLRTLSPVGIFRWSDIEATEGVFSWTAADFKINQLTNNHLIYASVTDDSMPAHGASNGLPIIEKLTNYVQQVVSRYKDRVDIWEGWNELNGLSGISESEQAQIEDAVAKAVKDADPSAVYFAFGGASSTTWTTNVWSLMTNQSLVDGIAVHLYPLEPYWGYPQSGLDRRHIAFGALASSAGKQLANTESGEWSLGLIRGDRTLWTIDAPWPWFVLEEEQFRRGSIPANNSVLKAIQTFAAGGNRFFYYDGRVQEFSYRANPTHPTWICFDDSMRPQFSAFQWVKEVFNDEPPTSYKLLSHPSFPSTIEGYLFGIGSKTVLWPYVLDFTNRTATLTSSNFGRYDLFGNLIATNQSTAPLTRHLQAWISTTLTTNDMENVFTSAVLSAYVDTVAPKVTVDATPAGSITTNDSPVRMKWTAIDDVYASTEYFPENVMTRWRLDGQSESFSDWSDSRIASFASLAPGTYQLVVQSKDAQGLSTNEVYGTVFTIPGGPGLRINATRVIARRIE